VRAAAIASSSTFVNAFAAALCLATAGCGRYADFQLPPPAGHADRAPTFRWELRNEPILARGAPGEWDSVDALNPSVVRNNGAYWNFYSGFDGQTWHTGLATSPDGLAWTKQDRILTPDSSTWERGYIAANGSALARNGEFFYWYQAGDPPRLGLARSRDRRGWTKMPKPVLDLGPRGSWDERGVADPYVIVAGNRFYAYYLGMDRARRQRLGVARSTDGVQWEKLRTNPILELGGAGEFDEIGLGEPAVWADAGRYWMLYTGRDRREYRRIGLAISDDGVRWQRSSAAPLLAGNAAWDDKVVCDPTVEVTPNGVRVWFGGGNVATPAERLNGQIGYAVLRRR
jgi:predicted GH43/DUF377 family glycosyl hydrolase